MPTKFQDDWFKNSWEILTFRPLENKTKQNKNFRKFESFRGGFLGNNKPKIGRCLQKNYDDWSISGWEIEERRFRHNIPCAPSPWCCPWGSSDGRNEFSRIYISCILIYKEKKNLTTMFFVERHLDVVLEDPLVVGEKSLFYKTCR